MSNARLLLLFVFVVIYMYRLFFVVLVALFLHVSHCMCIAQSFSHEQPRSAVHGYILSIKTIQRGYRKYLIRRNAQCALIIMKWDHLVGERRRRDREIQLSKRHSIINSHGRKEAESTATSTTKSPSRRGNVVDEDLDMTASYLAWRKRKVSSAVLAHLKIDARFSSAEKASVILNFLRLRKMTHSINMQRWMEGQARFVLEYQKGAAAAIRLLEGEGLDSDDEEV